MGDAGLHDLLHLFLAVDEDDAIGGLVHDPGGGVAMLFADALPGLETVAEALLEDAEDGGDALFVSGQFHQLGHIG